MRMKKSKTQNTDSEIASRKTKKWMWAIAIPALAAKGILWLIGILLGLGIVGLILLGIVGNVILSAYESVFQISI